jgi:predicted SAM-dependent methyltransferase
MILSKRALWEQYLKFRFYLTGRSIVGSYFKKNEVYKLQIGSLTNVLNGWLNSDIVPSHEVLYLDATKKFPFTDEQFHYVYSEHMIEHINFEQGRFMLGEVYRVLKKDGTFRIATPDLIFLINLYLNPTDSKNSNYIIWANSTFTKNSFANNPVPVVNNFFRNWGHQFIYDYETLSASLQSVGFTNVRKVEIGKSEIPALNGIESHWRSIGEINNALETMVIEADK